MTLPYLSQEPVSDPATGVDWSDDEGVLKTLRMKGVALAVCSARLSDQPGTWLDRLPPDRLPVLKMIVATEEVEKAVCAAALSARLPQDTEAGRFAKDVAHLSRKRLTRAALDGSEFKGPAFSSRAPSLRAG